MKTEVLLRGPARFSMGGQLLGYTLRQTDEAISAGLAQRLARYARQRLADSGFEVDGWEATVSTTDADMRPSERSYYVHFTNPKGGALIVEGILTGRGWPILDHGLAIEAA